jgi:hypothetical protein
VLEFEALLKVVLADHGDKQALLANLRAGPPLRSSTAKGVPMAESKEAWDRVGQDFRDLGRQVKERYEQRPEAGEEAADRRKVDDALRQLRDSLDQAFTALGDAVRDPQFGEQTRKAAGSLNDAVAATFAEVSERFKSRREPPPGPSGPGGGSGPQER